MTKKACDRCGSEMKSRMSRRSNRLLDRAKTVERCIDQTPACDDQLRDIQFTTVFRPVHSFLPLQTPLFSLCSRPSLSLFVSCKGQHVQKEQIFKMALILLLWFFHLPQPHPSLGCSHPSTCFELGQRRGWKERRGAAEGARDAVPEDTWRFPAEVRTKNNQNPVKSNNVF